MLPGLALAQGQGPAPVEVAEVQMRDIAPTVWVPGTVISRQDSRIAAEVAGNLLWLAEVGDQVHKGEVLARLDDRVWQLQLRTNQAELDGLRANLAFLERQLARNTQLAETNNASRNELERLAMETELTRSRLRSAEVALARTRYDLERAQIRAPFDGVVAARFHYQGEHLAVGDEVVRLTNTHSLEIRAQVPLASSRYMAQDSQVAVTGGDTTRVSRVRSLVPVGDERSRMLELRIAIEPGQWLIGEAVRVELPNGEARASLTVPRDALVLRERQVYVFKVAEGDKAQRVAISTGDGHGERISVQGELQAGDRVIVRGAERLQDGQALNVLKFHQSDLSYAYRK